MVEPSPEPDGRINSTERPEVVGSERAVVIAGSDQRSSRQACARAGLQPVVVVSPGEVMKRIRELRRLIDTERVSAVAIHSADWSRQSLQPLLELSAATIPCPRIVVLVGDGSASIVLSRRRVWMDLAGLPVAGSRGVAHAGRELQHLWALRTRPPVPLGHPRLDEGSSILAIWRGDPTVSTGGAVTHASGMLQGMRRRGIRVGLLTMCEPPEQLARAVDDVEVAAPLPRAARVTREIEDICLNEVLFDAGERLLERLRPALIYQRYDAFMTCGMRLSDAHRLPLVLEWNGSAAWARRNWRTRHRAKELFDPLLEYVERQSLARSALIRAVSTRAAEMAAELGADPRRVVAIANAVDLSDIPPPVQAPPTSALPTSSPPASAPPTSAPPTIGWVGSFGPWHGAPVLIQALAQVPGVRAVLVGDGAERGASMALARELGVWDRIEWTGQLPHDQAIARMRGCDVLASPHVPSQGRAFFGSPTKIYEFMAIGRPIVASALEQIADVLVDGRTACLVQPGDADDLARGLRRVAFDPDWGRALGRAARAEVEARHTWEHRAADLLACLRVPADPDQTTPQTQAASHVS